MIIKDVNLTIMVKDMDRSVSFYQSIGFKLNQRWASHYAQLSAGKLLIGLHPVEKNLSQGSGNLSIGFTTYDFQSCRDRLKELSIEVQERTEKGGEFLHFKDPDGTALYFINPKY